MRQRLAVSYRLGSAMSSAGRGGESPSLRSRPGLLLTRWELERQVAATRGYLRRSLRTNVVSTLLALPVFFFIWLKFGASWQRAAIMAGLPFTFLAINTVASHVVNLVHLRHLTRAWKERERAG